jgi:hypothetical protein
MSIMIRKWKSDERQAVRAPMVTEEGSFPERPRPWAHRNTS